MNVQESASEQERDSILQLIDQELYLEAKDKIFNLTPKERNHGRMIIALADCFYEIGDDVKAIEQYIRYMTLFPSGRGKNFALMGVAVALKNLDMQDAAKHILDMIDPSHEGLANELDHSALILAKQDLAKCLLRPILPFDIDPRNHDRGTHDGGTGL